MWDNFNNRPGLFGVQPSGLLGPSVLLGKSDDKSIAFQKYQ